MAGRTKIPFVSANYRVSPWPLLMLGEMLEYHFQKVSGRQYPLGMVAEWRHDTNRMAIERAGYDAVAEHLVSKARRDPAWTDRIVKVIRNKSLDFRQYANQYAKTDFSRLTGRRLWHYYADYRKKFIDLYTYAWLPNGLEGLSNVFTDTLEAYIRQHMPPDNQHQAGQYLSTLTTPLLPSFKQQERTGTLSLARLIGQRVGLKRLFLRHEIKQIIARLTDQTPRIARLIRSHHQRYCWLTHDYEGPAKNLAEVYLEIKHELRKGDVAARLLGLANSARQLRRHQRAYGQAIGLSRDRNSAKLFSLGRQLLYWKDRRKDILYLSYYRAGALFSAIAKRLNITMVQAKHMLPEEMKSALRHSKKPSIVELNRRIAYCVIVYESHGMRIYSGRHAHAVVRQRIATEQSAATGQLTGTCAYPGRATGTVTIINVPADMRRMRPGNILVSTKTNPNLLPAMKIAGAIVTEMGGITCHAAIVARELKIPCVVGAHHVTRRCRNGNRIKVDASRGSVTLVS